MASNYSLICFCLVIIGANAGKILLLSNVPSHSHSLWFNRLANLLSEQRHQVTLLDVDPRRPSLAANIKFYEMTGGFEAWEDDINGDLEAISTDTSSIKLMFTLNKWIIDACNTYLHGNGFAQFIKDSKNSKYDLVITDFMCAHMLGVVPQIGNPPIIMATAFADPAETLEFVGQYDNPSVVPHALTGFEPPMSFFERVYNTIVTLVDYSQRHLIYYPAMNKASREFWGENAPTVQEIGRNISFLFVNTHPILNTPKPMMANVAQIGGFHIEQPKEIPKDLQQFLDDAKTGVIYFSLGSNVRSSEMGKRIDMFVEAFKKLPYKILWKFEDQIPNLPENVKLGKWLPQNEILAHPNVKGFISHCGLLSTQEAIYHGVPIIGMPFIVDQHFNSAKLVKKGVAIEMQFATVTTDKIVTTIRKLMTDPSYAQNMRELSSTFGDRQNSPKETVLFWVNYFLKHPHSRLLQSATVDLYPHQLLCLDMAAFFLAIILLPIFSLYYCCCKKSKTTIKQKQKTS